MNIPARLLNAFVSFDVVPQLTSIMSGMREKILVLIDKFITGAMGLPPRSSNL
ncbi:MAG TPA: hypothetical protein VD993_10945 [Chitinophagaceae bacterium]|nr:hypothetical protein [Chitinophagaceae bacterium]